MEFCQGLNDNVVVQTSCPVQQCRTFQCTIPQIGGRSSLRFLLPLRMCLRRAPSLRRTRAPTPRKHPGLFRQPLEYSTTMMVTQSAAALAASNDVFTRSIRLYAHGRQSLVTSCLSLQKTPKKRTIYWVQGLCPNREKSLALDERGLKGLDRAKCPSANFSDRVLKPDAKSLLAKKDIVIFGMNAFGTARIAYAPHRGGTDG